MNKALFIGILLAITGFLPAQDICGDWKGILKIQGIKLHLVFHISKTDAGYSAIMDSPDQGTVGIFMTKTTFENDILTLGLIAEQMQYTGRFDSTTVTGTFTQGGISVPMNLIRSNDKTVEPLRPQSPEEPYPYYSEELTFRNIKDSITLAGTLTLPNRYGKFPVVILISGSGPQNRDEELMGHKPFLVLSDYLTRNGIGVFRYDDRGCFQSKGNFEKATTKDFANDVMAAVNFLKKQKDIDSNCIGLIGHSEGGIIAPMVAAKSKDVAYIVLMAGTAIPGSELLVRQQELIGRASGVSEQELALGTELNSEIFRMVDEIPDTETLKSKIRNHLTSRKLSDSKLLQGENSNNRIEAQLNQLTSPWMLNFIRYNPAPILEEVNCPVLAINGDKDLQVPSKINLPAIESALKRGGNNSITIKELPGLNHLFQECKTGMPTEYGEIEQTISPIVLETILNWTKEIINAYHLKR